MVNHIDGFDSFFLFDALPSGRHLTAFQIAVVSSSVFVARFTRPPAVLQKTG